MRYLKFVTTAAKMSPLQSDSGDINLPEVERGSVTTVTTVTTKNIDIYIENSFTHTHSSSCAQMLSYPQNTGDSGDSGDVPEVDASSAQKNTGDKEALAVMTEMPVIIGDLTNYIGITVDGDTWSALQRRAKSHNWTLHAIPVGDEWYVRGLTTAGATLPFVDSRPPLPQAHWRQGLTWAEADKLKGDLGATYKVALGKRANGYYIGDAA